MSNVKNICGNCRTALHGEYCHNCGQRANEPRRAVIGLVQDVFVDTLWIDSRLWRSILLLLWKPGRLARYYLDGKRVRYTPPFRMYLFASVFFFFFMFFLIGFAANQVLSDDPSASRDFIAGFQEGLMENDAGDEAAPPETDQDAAPTDNDITITVRTDQQEADTTAPEPGDETVESEDNNDNGSWLDSEWDDEAYDGPEWFRVHAKRLSYSFKRVVEEPRLYINSLQSNLPRVLLLAPLLYALLLALFYCYRRKFLFYDHLIVSLYMHAALYAYLLLAILLTLIPGVGWFLPLLMIWPLLQPFAVLRQAYGSNWFSVVGKGFIIFHLYHAVLSTLILFGVSYALYQS